jgi:hypothetical protein
VGTFLFRGTRCPLRSYRIERKCPKKEYRWHIYRIKATPAEYLGNVTAADEEEAIRKATVEFKITDPQMQKRLLAQRMGLPLPD